MSLLDGLNVKQRAKEFKATQKALRSKDVAVRLSTLEKLNDLRYFTEGQCLPSFLESLTPSKKLLEYLVPASQWFANLLITQSRTFTALEHPILQCLLNPDVPIVDVQSYFQGLLTLLKFKEELKPPKMPKGKKAKELPPPVMPVENPVYGNLRRLVLKILYYLTLPVQTTTQIASDFQFSIGRRFPEALLTLLADVAEYNYGHYRRYRYQEAFEEATLSFLPDPAEQSERDALAVTHFQNTYYALEVLGFLSRHVPEPEWLRALCHDPARQRFHAELLPVWLKEEVYLQRGAVQYLLAQASHTLPPPPPPPIEPSEVPEEGNEGVAEGDVGQHVEEAALVPSSPERRGESGDEQGDKSDDLSQLGDEDDLSLSPPPLEPTSLFLAPQTAQSLCTALSSLFVLQSTQTQQTQT